MFGARVRSAPPARVPSSGIGMFAGNPLPVDPRGSLMAARLGLMTGPPGLRLSGSSNRPGRYFGTELVRALPGAPAHVNQSAQLEVAALKAR